MSSNNVNIVNTNNWYQKMNTNGTQNITNMVLSGTNPSTQMALISVANDVHYLSSNYQLSKTNGFTLTFQFYITGTSMNSICAYFGVTDPTTSFDANGGLANQSGAVELMIRPGNFGAGQNRFNLYTNYGSNTIAATNATSITTFAWQTVTITYTPSTTGTWVVNYNGTNVISYNDTSFTTFASNQNTVWGIYGATGGSSAAFIRAVDLSVKQSMPMSILKNTYSFYPEECFINKLSTHSQTNAAAAFGLRLLKADYLGPVINIRRGSDNATLDFYADSKGNIGTTLYGTGTTLLTWLAGSIGYVTRWYDQTGNGRDVINTTSANQPKIGTPILDTMSSAGKSAARGVYALYRANSTYSGATIKLRRSTDNATSDFYSDVYGNLNNSLSAENAVNTWTARTSNLASQGIAWSPSLNLFAATNYNGGSTTTSAIQTSPDGITWTTRTTPSIQYLSYIIWAPEVSLFVATSYQAGTSSVLTSPDGINWTQRTTPNIADGISAGLADVTWNGSLFVCVNQGTTANTNWVITSPDGINWTQRTTPSGRNWIGVSWSPQLSLFVAVNNLTPTTSGVATSPDGITWTIRTTPSVSQLSRVRWSPGLNLFVAVGINSCITSPDGINWTSRSVPSGQWGGLVWSSELSIFAATRMDLSTNCIMTSSDGITWTSRVTPSTRCWDIAWSPSLSTFVAVNPLSTTLITSAQGLIANSTYNTWIGSSTAYVDTWYDQSGSGNHSTQSTTNSQPIYNGTLKLLDFSNSSFLNMPSGTIPTGTLNAPYTFVVKHGATGSIPSNGASIVSGGAGAQNQLNGVLITSNYHNYWYDNDITYSRTPVTGNVFVCKYDGTTRTGYVNNNYINSAASSGYTVTSGQQYIGKEIRGASTQFTGQLYNVFIFGTSLSDADRMACTGNPTDLNIKYDGSTSYLYNGSSVPLTSGSRNYTYVFNGRVDNNSAGNAAIDQWTNARYGDTRAGLLFYYGAFGFCGESNDALSMISYSNFVNRKVVMMCNHNLNSNNVTINDNGSIYTASTRLPAVLNNGADAFAIGRRSTGNSEHFTGNINEVIVFRNTLTLKESQIYFTPNAITRKNYRSQPRLQIKDTPKDIGAIPTGAVVQLDTQMLANMSPGSLVTSWNGTTGLNNPVLNAGISGTGIHYTIPPYVSLTNNNVSASLSTGQYLNAGSKTFNINTNGGFTAIWYGAFTGSANNHERIFDFGSGTSNNILAGRNGTTSSIYFYMNNGGTAYNILSGNNMITQNEWAVWTFRYTASTRFMEILKNSIQYTTGTAGAAITDRTLTNTWIGRSNWTQDTYSSINTAGLYVYASYLTDAQVASVSNHLMYCTTTSMPSALPEYNNKVVRYGHILSQGFRNGQAMYFKGVDTTSYLDIQDVPNWPLTFCFWFNHVNIYGFTNISPAALCSADLAGAGIQFDMDQSGTRIVAAYWNSSINAYSQFTNSAVSLNTWYHIAFVVTPTTAAYYLNGSLVQSVNTVLPNTNRIIIGKSGDNGRPFNGYIQDIRVFDYALRADEISYIYGSVEERALTNYNAQKNYLVNMSNWYSIMNINKTGTFNIVSAGTDPNIQYRLTSNGVANSSNTVFNSTKIQNYNSFTCSFENWSDTVTDHGFYFYCGATSSTTVPTGTAGTAANSSYYIYFQVTGTRGIYLFNDQGQQLAYSPLPNVITNQVYTPITIVYNRSTTNTWTVNVASNDILTYNDPNNANWVSNIAGDFWGIGARTTTSGMNSYIRRVELSYTPFVNSINNTINAQNNVKFPPGAMTAESTTFIGTGILDGVYSLTASSANNPIYYAFDNNTTTSWGFPTGVFGGANGSYTGPWSHTVKNLTTNTIENYSGSWIQIQVPNPLQLTSFSLMGRQELSLFTWRTPNTFYIAGSNDSSTWELIHSTSGAQYTSAMQYFTCNKNNTNKYKYFRLIVNKIGNNGPGGDPGGNNYLEITAWDLYTQMNTVNAGVVAVPPYSMTANTTTFAGNSVYDGTYILTASSAHSHPTMGPIYTIFNDTYGTYGNVSSTGANYNNSTGVYGGPASTTVSGVTQSGDWIQIQIPNPIVLYSFSLRFWWDGQNYWAKSFLIAASNDAITWTNIYDTTNANFVYSTAQTFVVTGSPNAYRYFRLIVRATSGISLCDWWILDQWKLYTNASNFNLTKFPPAPLTADSPVTFTTVNQKNWYNVMTYGVTSGGFTPILTQSDPFKQLQLSNGSTSNVNTYCYVSQTPTNYSSFVLSFQLYATNVNSGEFVNLYFGGGGYVVQYLFEIAAFQGIRMNTSSVANPVVSATNWWNSTWNDIRIEYKRGPTNTWTMFFNETQILQYSDPNWARVPGGTWGFQVYNTTTRFDSYIRQLEMTIAPQTLPGNNILSGNYIASASSIWDNNGLPSYAFGDNIWNASNYGMWHSGPSSYSNGAYTGGYTTTVSGTSYSGEWLQLQAPNALQLVSFGIYPRQDSSLFQRRSPRNFVMAGSNNGSTWDLLHTATGISDWTAAEKYFVCNGSNVANKYSYFRLIVMAVGNPNPGTGDFVNITNLNLYTPITLNNSITPATPKGLLDGLTWKYYNGYSSDSVSHYTTNTYTNIGRCIDTSNMTTLTNGQYPVNGTDSYSMEIFGYFRATVSGTYTFYLASDDGSFMWIGSNALVGYTTSNANINNGGSHAVTTVSSTVTLLAGTYYPIRIHFSEGGGGDDLQFSFTPPGGTRTYNGQGYYFSGTGLDSAFPQESAKIIKDLTGTNTDGVYYILVNGISTPIHCLMNDCYDGGGWMILMKGTRGTTFQYSANYWTRKNTLNAGDLTRSDADAKYDTFNYSTVKDVLAIFPDIPSTSYTNPYGQNGGSIFVSDGWTWMVNNWNETSRITPLTGFNTPRNPHVNTTSLFQTYGINNPFRYNGFGTWCSSQTGAYWHGFSGSGNYFVRWGFLFNNETGDYNSSDAYVGIGMGGGLSYSAGDHYGCCGTAGINRSARFELYGR
jgi:hypothetical protein